MQNRLHYHSLLELGSSIHLEREIERKREYPNEESWRRRNRRQGADPSPDAAARYRAWPQLPSFLVLYEVFGSATQASWVDIIECKGEKRSGGNREKKYFSTFSLYTTTTTLPLQVETGT